jgi:hypothetical protein
MDYFDEYVNAFEHGFDDDDFDEFEEDQDFQTFDFYPDLAQRDPFGRDRFDRDRFDRDRFDRDRFDRDRFRPIGERRRVRCCVYRNRNTGRIRRVCQDRDRRCAGRLGRNWVLVSSFTARNCNRCI